MDDCDWLLSVEKACDWLRIEPGVTVKFFLGHLVYIFNINRHYFIFTRDFEQFLLELELFVNSSFIIFIESRFIISYSFLEI